MKQMLSIFIILLVAFSNVAAFDSWKLIGNPWTEFDPDWSPDGAKIAYCDKRINVSSIYAIPVNGGTPVAIVSDTSDNREPAWSPDGREIAYRSDRTGNWDIFIVDVSTGVSRQLTDHPDDDSWPDWSPDGSMIVFSSIRDGDRDLYIIPASGGQAKKVAELPTWDEYPCWSNDGKKFVFTDIRNIFTVNIDGTGYNTLIDETERVSEPFWSPDDTNVVFIGGGSNSREVFIKPYPNGEIFQVTDDIYEDGWPCYSPDGRYIAFSKHTDNWGIWILDISSINIERTSLGKIKTSFK